MSHESRRLYYAPDQVILRGRHSEVDAVVARLKLDRITLDLVWAIDLSVLPPHTAGEEMALYTIIEPGATQAVLESVARLVAGYAMDVAFAYNYRVGRPLIPTTGDPWGVEGSPWGVEGSPWSHEGPPGTGGATPQDDFVKQWGLGPLGIRQFDDAGGYTTGRRGNTVCVGIFDTSPYEEAGTQGVERGVPSPWSLQVLLPEVFWQIPEPPRPVDICDHGLFVAGLVHAMAPASTLVLVRVLDKYGQGDVFTLCNAVVEFAHRMFSARRQGSFDGAVVNLSLGISPNAIPNIPGVTLDDCVSYIASLVEGAGLVVAAAAGNDSWCLKPDELKPAQSPAKDLLVLGVQASDIGGGRACFSNLGDIAAPGCGLLSLVTPDDDNESGYAYWAGTSFATALVSGLAAQLVPDNPWAPAAVRVAISGNTIAVTDPTLPGGIAKVP